MSKKILSRIREELESLVEPAYQAGAGRYFKEEVHFIGLRTPLVRKISAKYFKEIKHLPKSDILNLCEDLLGLNTSEERTIAFDWTHRLKRQFEKEDFKLFEAWLKKYVSNWGACDDFSTHALGCLVYIFPDYLKKTLKWAGSKNQWLRRAAAVVLIYSIRRRNILKEVFKVCDELLLDNEDLVQKGYGWLLKEAANCYQREVFNYVMQHKDVMPRTALRYAIEKMPPELKQKAMKRG